MKTCVIQPPYCMDFGKSDAYFAWEIEALDRCTPDMDLIVLPEYSNVPCLAKTKAEMEQSFEKYGKVLLQKASETAKRCAATLFVNCIMETPTGKRNTTVAFNKAGEMVGQYYKRHLVNSEMHEYELDRDYTYEHTAPTILEIDGVRYGFLICYDFYFYEAFANIARYNPDVIVACAYQRSDTHRALEIMAQFCAYNCNAYVVRSSVSLGENSPVGGCSMVVAPDGQVLLNLKNEASMGVVEFDPHARYLKAAGFGNEPATHHAYIEAGRRPWQYRPGGSAIVPHNDVMTYPRVCAHRGFSAIAPENSLPAFGAAVAMGAEEIEFDIWQTADGKFVSFHDRRLAHDIAGEGNIWELTFDEIMQYDFGAKYGVQFEGMRIPTLEEILKKFACHTVMNMHIKTPNATDPLPQNYLTELIRLIDLYDCRKYVYFMCGNKTVLKQLRVLAPDIARCAGASADPVEDLVEKAIETGARKIQLFKPHFEHNAPDYVEKTIQRAHENGITCNVFFADDPEEAKHYFDLGADTVLTNDYYRIATVAKSYKRYYRDPLSKQ